MNSDPHNSNDASPAAAARMTGRPCAVRAVRWRGGCWLLCLLCGIGGAGCKSTLDTGIGGIFGPTGRQAKQDLEMTRRGSPLEPMEGMVELDKAREIYDAKKYGDAYKAYKKIAKKYKNKPAEEDAMYMMAECKFADRRYAAAQDAYGELLKKYATTQYLERSTKRLFSIARKWLDEPATAPPSDIELANYSSPDSVKEEAQREATIPWRFPLKPNLTDRSQPTFDTPGRALQALNSIWLHDPTGPLADDALMMSAMYSMRKRDFKEADRFFTIIRQEYPQSEHSQAAYIMGSHAKQMAYQGARYDGRQLEEAKKLTQNTVRLYPDLPQREKLLGKLSQIQKQTAERDWERIQLYRRRNEKKSAAIYCEMLIEAFPNSPYAEQARQLLREWGPEYAAGLLKDSPALEKKPAGQDFTEPDGGSAAPGSGASVPEGNNSPEGSGEGPPGRSSASDSNEEPGRINDEVPGRAIVP